MDVREKLVELFYDNNVRCDQKIEGLADDVMDIIANGVTVQEWIPVTERLPENDTYILATTDGVVVSAYWHNDRFYAFTANGVATVGCVTHWMPLPQPPKGE
jgi:hypothetical protein